MIKRRKLTSFKPSHLEVDLEIRSEEQGKYTQQTMNQALGSVVMASKTGGRRVGLRWRTIDGMCVKRRWGEEREIGILMGRVSGCLGISVMLCSGFLNERKGWKILIYKKRREDDKKIKNKKIRKEEKDLCLTLMFSWPTRLLLNIIWKMIYHMSSPQSLS